MVRPDASPARPEAMRRHNLALVLAQIHRSGALTRAELTQRLAISRSTVGTLVNDLNQLGLVEEAVPAGGRSVGRPSHVVAPHRHAPFAVAVDLDVTHVTVAAVALGGEVLAREVVDMPLRARSPAAIALLVARSIPRLARSCEVVASPAGIGVSVPGTVDRETGRVGNAPNLGWVNASLGAVLSQQVPDGVPVAIGNDADLAVLAEHQRGNAQGSNDVVFVMGRVGVGAGILINGQPLRGHLGHAGEIGHTVLDPNGAGCHCGKRGCVETYIGAGALLGLARRPDTPTDEAIRAVLDDARAGDATALAAVHAVAEPLGRTIGALLNTLNPQTVLLGGWFAPMLDLARDHLEDSIGRYSLDSASGVEVKAPALGQDSALLGAAEIAFANLLADPSLRRLQ